MTEKIDVANGWRWWSIVVIPGVSPLLLMKLMRRTYMQIHTTNVSVIVAKDGPKIAVCGMSLPPAVTASR